MVHCAVNGCNNNNRKKQANISFHRFPTNIKKRNIWIKNMIKDNDWTPTPTDRLCSLHFEPSCFYRIRDKTYLDKMAVPTILSQTQQQDESRASTPSPIPTTSDDEVSIKTKLTRKLSLVIRRNNEKTKKIRVLTQNLKRKKMKIVSLKNDLQSLEKKYLVSLENINLMKTLLNFKMNNNLFTKINNSDEN